MKKKLRLEVEKELKIVFIISILVLNASKNLAYRVF